MMLGRYMLSDHGYGAMSKDRWGPRGATPLEKVGLKVDTELVWCDTFPIPNP